MSLWCSFIGHKEPAAKLWNDGLFFGQCPRCRDEIISAANGRRWHGLPRRVKIVWKPRGPHAIDWYDAIDAAPRRRPIRAQAARGTLVPAE